MWFYMKYIA